VTTEATRLALNGSSVPIFYHQATFFGTIHISKPIFYHQATFFGTIHISKPIFFHQATFFGTFHNFKADFFHIRQLFLERSTISIFCWLGKKVATPNIEGCFSFGKADFLLLRTFSFLLLNPRT
jgi:hypothetical protein